MGLFVPYGHELALDVLHKHFRNTPDVPMAGKDCAELRIFRSILIEHGREASSFDILVDEQFGQQSYTETFDRSLSDQVAAACEKAAADFNLNTPIRAVEMPRDRAGVSGIQEAGMLDEFIEASRCPTGLEIFWCGNEPPA
jgi:hypothetical protein